MKQVALGGLRELIKEFSVGPLDRAKQLQIVAMCNLMKAADDEIGEIAEEIEEKLLSKEAILEV